MASYNKIILMGNLTRDPQLSYLPSQTPVVEIGLAVNHKYKDQQGQMQDKVCFVDCRSIGRQAETLSKYMKKGRPLLIEGRLEFDQWEAQDGSKRSKHRVFIERFTFVDNQGGGGGQGGYAPQQQQQPQQQYGGQPQQAPAGDGYAPQQQPPQQQPPQQQPPAQQAPPNSYDDAPPAGEDIPF
ncbi:MAG: single-stranded DNA-binding protein [Phycisphaerae bacterium]|nr:single-stranded DNA-binding protein [Phycisphaerae bacterium]